jgi:general secretion pathway protein G
MSRKRSRRRRGGFTLMEVLLVLAILVILGALAFFSFSDVLFGANTKAAKVQIDGLKVPIAQFLLEEGRYPGSLEELSSPGPRTGRIHLDQPVGLDPWGAPYGYEVPSDTSNPNLKPRIWSNGPDMQQGTGDDITNQAMTQ